MANARDIIPIVAAGLGGLIGGAPTARAVTNAAQISRQGRVDKEYDERRTQLMANSARHLQLSEKAAERAEQRHDLSMDRYTLDLAKKKEDAKKAEEATAHFKRSRDEWVKANPEAVEDPQWLIKYNLVKDNPGHFLQFTNLYAEDTGRPSLAEAQIMGEELGPGQQLSIMLNDGTRLTARGLSDGKAGGIPEWKMNSTIFQGQKAYDTAVKDARVELAKYKDTTKKMLAKGADDGSTQGTEEANLRQQIQQQMEVDFQDLLNNPNREWNYWQEHLGGLGLSQEGMNSMRGVFDQTVSAERQRQEEAYTSARELSNSENEIIARARGKEERIAAGLPVAEEAIPEEIPQDGLSPLGRTIAGGAESAWEGWKKAVNTARETYGMKPRRSHER